MIWLDDFERALGGVRMPARRRRRIYLELEDHLASDATAADRLGDPAELAARFVNEVGTSLSRQASFAIFLALAPLGLLFGVLFALQGAAHLGSTDPNLVGPSVIFGTQIAFVGGVLALLRAYRLRDAAAVPGAQARILLRRSALGLAGGLLTVAGIVAGALQAPGHVASWYVSLAYATAGIGVLTLLLAGITLVRASRLQPVTLGTAQGDLESDLGPLVPMALRGNPWRLALSTAALVALCIALAGIVQGDPFDGLARALTDAFACLAGFLLLGRWLGLRA
jgi:hypothetical protein